MLATGSMHMVAEPCNIPWSLHSRGLSQESAGLPELQLLPPHTRFTADGLKAQSYSCRCGPCAELGTHLNAVDSCLLGSTI